MTSIETNPVAVVGPGPSSQGGISAVIGMHHTCQVWKSHQCVWIQTMNGGGKSTKLATAVSALVRFIHVLPRTRLVHIHMAMQASIYRKLVFFTLAAVFRKTIIIHLHSPNLQFTGLMSRPGLGRTVCRWMLRKADCVVALSPTWERLILEHVPEAATTCLPNPYWLPPSFRPAPRKGQTVLYLNRIESRKGYEHFLGAIPRVLQSCPETKFVMAGHGEIAAAQRLVRELGVENAVEFPGWVEGEQKWSLLAQSTLLCLPSYQEGVPITLLEAMAAGLPAVTTPVGGIPDVITHEVNGLLVSPGDIGAIADSLVRLLRDGDLRARLADAAQNLVEKNNSLSAVNSNLENLYAWGKRTKGSREPLTAV